MHFRVLYSYRAESLARIRGLAEQQRQEAQRAGERESRVPRRISARALREPDPACLEPSLISIAGSVVNVSFSWSVAHWFVSFCI